MRIIDASVALKWFVEESEGAEAAGEILAEVESEPGIFAVPDLFFAEMLHVLCRLFSDSREAKECIEILEQMGIERIGLGHELLARAADLAGKHGVSGYDAIYAACAQLAGGKWLTFDERAHHKLEKLKISEIPGRRRKP